MSETADLPAVVETAPPAVVEPTPAGPGALLSVIVQLAQNPSVDVDKFERLLAMQERMETKQAERDFNAALHAAQQEMPRVKKNGTIDLGGKGSIPFAKWEDIDAVLRPIMQKHGLSLSFDASPREGGGAIIAGTLRHSAGHAKTASIPLPLDSGPGRNNLQAMGSTLSYGKRYLAEMFFNIVREGVDDDGKTGGDQPITPDQAEQIATLVDETNTDPAAFLEWVFGDERPHHYGEIPAQKFATTLNALISKKRKMAKEPAQ